MNNTKSKIMRKTLAEIEGEMEAQVAKWGVQNHNPVEWIAILTEEVGEASKEAVDYHFDNVNPKNRKEVLKRYRKELIQVAAVAASMIESLDRNELNTI